MTKLRREVGRALDAAGIPHVLVPSGRHDKIFVGPHAVPLSRSPMDLDDCVRKTVRDCRRVWNRLRDSS